MSSRLAIEGGEPAVTGVVDRPARFDDSEAAALRDVLRSERLFRYLEDGEGQVRAFERRFADLMGSPHCLAVSSGTAALICALVGLGVGPGDEVILPGYTYISSAAAILNVRAVPVIAEVDASLTLDPDDVERRITPFTRAIMPVHMRGVPCRMDRLMAIARKHELSVIEDTAQACGGSFGGRRLGAIGDAGCFSLQHYKIITTGEGGALVTANEKLLARATMYHDAGRPFWVGGADLEAIPGVNYRMSELAGALGRVQIEKLDSILDRQRRVKRQFLEAAASWPGVSLQDVPDAAGDCALVLILFLPTSERASQFAAALKAEGCACGAMYSGEFPDRHIFTYWDHILEKKGYSSRDNPWTHPYYQGDVEYSADMYPRTLDFLGRAVAIPLQGHWSAEDVTQRIEAIGKVSTAFAE